MMDSSKRINLKKEIEIFFSIQDTKSSRVNSILVGLCHTKFTRYHNGSIKLHNIDIIEHHLWKMGSD